MADIVSNIQKLNDIEVSQDEPLTEALITKIGANINGLIDADTANAAAELAQAAQIAAFIAGASNIAAVFGTASASGSGFVNLVRSPNGGQIYFGGVGQLKGGPLFVFPGAATTGTSGPGGSAGMAVRISGAYLQVNNNGGAVSAPYLLIYSLV